MTVSIHDAPEAPGEADIAYPLGLLTPLHTLPLPAEVGKFLLRHKLVTVGDVVALHPAQLGQATHSDRRSVAALRAAVEKVCGIPWEEAWLQGCEGESPQSQKTQSGPTPKTPEGRWATLGRRIDVETAQRLLSEVRGLPPQMRLVAKSRGIVTVGDLLAVPEEDLQALRGIGQPTVRKTLAVLSRLAKKNASGSTPDLHRFADLAALWRAQTASLAPLDRKVVHLRSGLKGPAPTLREVGTTMRFSYERARQIEKRALAEIRTSAGWVEPLAARLRPHLGAEAVSLDTLAQEDPWLAPLRDHPDLFEFLNQHFLKEPFYLVRLGDAVLLSRAPQEDFDKALHRIDKRLASQRWPAPRKVLDDILAGCAAPLGEAGRQWLAAQVTPSLKVSDDGQEVLGYSSTRKQEILVWLRARGEPVSVQELTQRFGRGLWPEEIVHLESERVTLTECLPGFEALADALVLRCVQHMKARGPRRPWSTAEFAAMLANDPTLPPWFGPSALATMLYRSPNVRYSSRGVVGLPAAEDEDVRLRDALVEVLQAAGSPLTFEEIGRRVTSHRERATHGLEATLKQPPFVETAPNLYGLLARDVPGGPDAVARAVESLVEALTRRDRGLSLWGALALLADQDTIFGRWTESMLRSVCRHEPRLLINALGAVGMAVWGSVRVPSRRELIREALPAGQSRVLVSEVLQRIDALYGPGSARNTIGWTAWKEGMALEGGWLVRKAEAGSAPDAAVLDAAAPMAAPGWPDLPAEFVARWASLCALEDAGEDLGRTVDAHVQGFYLGASSRPVFDLTKVLKARKTCHALLADAASAPRKFRQAARAAVRFFVLNDTAWDKSLRGLDTSLAVLEAVGRHREDKAPAKAGATGAKPARGAKGSKREPAPP